jgi:2-dehydro-3-deoxyglucarate aldolase
MSFKKRLQQKELLLGTMLTLPSAEVAEMISNCGYDWLFIDGEHGPLATLDCQRLLQAVAGRCASLIRVVENTEAEFKRVLDIGAEGVIAPRVNSAEEARQIVEWCKYPPDGMRGVGLGRAHGYGYGFSEYMETANQETVVVVQAEHIDAVENIESIVQVDGVDAVFIGPYDLSASMNKMGQIDDAEVIDAIATVTRVCQQNKMTLGYFGVSAESVKPYIDQGYNLICAGVDAGFVTSGASQIIENLK